MIFIFVFSLGAFLYDLATLREDVRAISSLILRSAPLRASRRMNASHVLSPSFETLASQAPQDEVKKQLRPRSAKRSRFAGNSPPSSIRGRRECRMRAAPAVPCAK